MWHALPDYLRMRSAQEALIAPALISLILWHTGPRKRLPEFSGVLFLAGLALSIVFSCFRDADGESSIHALPGYAFLMILMPARFHPSWRQSFALSFATMLAADVWGAATHFWSVGAVPVTFYYGIGGAGLQDGLFVTPWILVISFAQMEWVRRCGMEKQGLLELTVALARRVFGFQASALSK
jgi:hypothetical protein